jgi:hypothetical protein
VVVVEGVEGRVSAGWMQPLPWLGDDMFCAVIRLQSAGRASAAGASCALPVTEGTGTSFSLPLNPCDGTVSRTRLRCWCEVRRAVTEALAPLKCHSDSHTPAGVPWATCSRSRSPTEMCTKSYCRQEAQHKQAEGGVCCDTADRGVVLLLQNG